MRAQDIIRAVLGLNNAKRLSPNTVSNARACYFFNVSPDYVLNNSLLLFTRLAVYELVKLLSRF